MDIETKKAKKVTDIKILLEKRIVDYDIEKSKLFSLKDNISIMKDIIEISNSTFEVLHNNISGVALLLGIVYSEQEAKIIAERLENTLYKALFNKDCNIEEVYNEKNAVVEDLIYTLSEKEIEFMDYSNYINNKAYTIQQYRYILNNIKHNGYINPQGVSFLYELLKPCGFSETEIVDLIEKINISHVLSVNKKPNYSVINIVNSDFEKYEISSFDESLSKNSTMNYIDSLYSIIIKNGFEKSKEYLPKTSDNVYNTYNEFEYIMKNLINRMIDKLIESKKDITDVETYTDKELKGVAIMEYYEIYEKLSNLKKYYNEKINEYEKEEGQQVIEVFEEPVNNIMFLEKDKNYDSSYMEDDLKSIPPEFYFDVLELLDKFKYGKTNTKNDKSFKNNKNLEHFRELKKDQIRILYRRIKDNNFLVVGAFQKQADVDLNNYNRMVNRNKTIILDDQLKQQYEVIEERVREYINDNIRNRTR
ncbi:MAG TPA: hypothetical protein PLV83_04610 [Bacilli bacterium]|nr:hypothetical protein [Bacilli bacterium]